MGYTGPAGTKMKFVCPLPPCHPFSSQSNNNSGAEIKGVCGWTVTDHLPIKNFWQFIKTHVTRHPQTM
jgi:hypothetical protein